MNQPARRTRSLASPRVTILVDTTISVALIVLGFIHYGTLYLKHEDRFLFYQKYFFSAVNLYCVNDPDVREYNSHTQTANERIDLSAISCDEVAKSSKVTESQYNGWHDTHPIMSNLIGLMWKSTNFSWQALWPIAGLLGALTLLSFYLMQRTFGVPSSAALLLLPAVIPYDFIEQNFYYLRDYSKAPFILLALACLGPLFTAEATPRRRVILLCGSTLLIVIGMGFRQDAVVLMPSILTGAILTTRFDRGWPYRLFGEMVTVAAVYLLAGQAMALLKTSQVSQLQGYPHFVIQGFGDPFLREARSLVQGISFLTLYSDMLAWALVDANTLTKVRYFVFFDPNYTSSGLDLISKYAGLSAADMVVRALQSLTVTARNNWLVQSTGLWLLLILALITTRRWRLGIFLAVVIASLGSAGSLQFSARHIVHLIMMDRMLLVIAGTAFVGALWQMAILQLAAKVRLALTIAFTGALALTVVIVGAHAIQQRNLKALSDTLTTLQWFDVEKDYERAFPERSESLLRLTIGGDRCRSTEIQVVIENEGQRIVRFVTVDPQTTRPLYFALLNPEIEEVRVDVSPPECVWGRAWAPLGDGRIPPLQFFDPSDAIEGNSLSRHLIRAFRSFW